MKAAKTQADTNMNFDGMEKMSSKRQPVSGNQWSGHSNDGRTVNYGRGPVRGNDGMCCQPKNTGGNPTRSPVQRPPSHVHDTHAPGAYGKAPYRGQGGTVVRKPSADAKIRIGQSGSVF